MHKPDYRLLDDAELDRELAGLPQWQLQTEGISRTYKFSTFRQAIRFVNLLAEECEEHNHHPSLLNDYKTIRLSFVTHAVGDKITDRDIKLAKIAEELAAALTKENV